jgi:hypothetical protein
MKKATTYTLRWSKQDKTIILQRPGKTTIKYGNRIPQGVIQAEAAKLAKSEGAALNIVDD